MKTTYKKSRPKIITYRSYKYFNNDSFREVLLQIEFIYLFIYSFIYIFIYTLFYVDIYNKSINHSDLYNQEY